MDTTKPTNQPSQPANQNVTGQVVKKEPKVILVVEDDPVLLKMYTEKFTFEGFKVLNARNGEEALKVTLANKVDIILLDIMLPRVSGTDFLVKLRQDPRGKAIPVVALTNLAEETERQRALELGVKEYLVKAMQTPEQVVEKMKKYLAD
jgi:CheY-like chemotaxis protein